MAPAILFFFLRERGENVQDFAKGFYRSKAWQHCRDGYARSVGGLCERCRSKGLYRAGEIVHHVRPITADNITDPTVTLSWDNLELVCRDCHGELHRRKVRRYRVVDELGHVTA